MKQRADIAKLLEIKAKLDAERAGRPLVTAPVVMVKAPEAFSVMPDEPKELPSFWERLKALMLYKVI